MLELATVSAQRLAELDGQGDVELIDVRTPVQIRMNQLLLHGRYTVGELAEDCGIPDNVASEHLRLMQRCGFLSSEREGRRVYYQVAEPHLEKIVNCIESRFLT